MKILVCDDSGNSGALLTALNAIELPEGCEIVALNFELPADGSVPEWVELIPAGQMVTGRDGRTFVNNEPQGILDFLAADGRDIPVDWEHATEIKAPQGGQAPAAAWIPELQLREGAVWGRMLWTPKGRASVENREYRYLSPAILIEKETGRIRGISSIGLVNKPNFRMPAINRQQRNTEEETMDWKKLLAKLGLPEDATLEQALNAIGKMQGDLQTALNRAETPSLDKFVPRADYDAALGKANNFEQKLKEKEAADLETAINAEVSAAVAAGKVTPGTKDYYVGMCRQEGGLEAFKKFVEAAPVIGNPSDLGKRTPEGGGVALNAEQKQIADMFGNSEEDLKKYGG
ncbi:phage protease [Desulfuromonas sp. TF]|uniref:phage protease n=1 Tax=Desulfuromonas sp. TF TaxID=1232410 RepID=UPI0003F5820C|nr:phage protease [Desulfuromonas sp. TF]